MATCSWKIEENKKSSSDRFLKVRPDCKLRVRLIGNPVKVVRVFSNGKKCVVVDNENVGQQLKQKYAHIVGNISVRYACWCIDRDSNAMRILDMPRSVARMIGSRAEIIGREISGIKEGCDWAVGTNGKTGKDVRYEAVYIEETPLSDSEKQMVEDRKSEQDGHFDLRKIFKSHSFEEAEEKILN